MLDRTLIKNDLLYRRKTTGQVVQIQECNGLVTKGDGEANWRDAIAYLDHDNEENDILYVRTIEDFCEKFEEMSEQG